MKKIALTLLTIILLAVLTTSVEAAPTKGTPPKKAASTVFLYPMRYIDTVYPGQSFAPDAKFLANKFYFLKMTGIKFQGNSVPTNAQFISVGFDIYGNANPLYCSLWYTGGYSEPVTQLWGTDFSSFLYDTRGRSGGSDKVLLNPTRKGGGGIWVMSTCNMDVRIWVYGWS